MTALRLPSETLHSAEIEALIASDGGRPKPTGWAMSPTAVLNYVCGGRLPDGTAITPKYIGNRRLVETAIATMATDRALLLLGVPGTAKSTLSEHMAAAISGNSQLMIQCTAGTDENAVRYGWNYAKLLAEGPSDGAVVQTPMMRGMQDGKTVRLEELTRMGSDVMDTLITILSEKVMPIPELSTAVSAQRGFNVIATANNKDKGVNELSSALKRRFNVVVLPLPSNFNEEVSIVQKRVGEIGSSLELPTITSPSDAIKRVVRIFRELRDGKTDDNRIQLTKPSGDLSTGEAISVMVGAWTEAAYFGSDNGTIDATRLAGFITGAVVKDPVQDKTVLKEYLDTVVRRREGWNDLYKAISEVVA